MTSDQPTVLFFARDFLADEFSGLGRELDGYRRLYITSNRGEAERVSAVDPAGDILVIEDFVRADGPPGDDAMVDQLYGLVWRDRFLSRRSAADIRVLLGGLAQLKGEIAKFGKIALSLDEPISGFVNDMLDQHVRASGGVGAHFNHSWMPGYLWFCQGRAQSHPIPLNMQTGGREITAEHIAKRRANLGLPNYMMNFSGKLRPVASGLKYAAMGARRRMVKGNFLDGDPWPHDFQAKSLLASVWGGYDSVDDLRPQAEKFVVWPLHYEPEAVVSYWAGDFINQLAPVMELFESLDPDTCLVLKEHPSQPGALKTAKWQELLVNERVRPVHGLTTMKDVLQLPSAVVSIASTAALEAVMIGRPVHLIGYPHFREMPGISQVSNLRELSIDWNAEPVGDEAIVDWYAEFFDSNCVPGQIMRGKTSVDDPARLIAHLANAETLPL